MRPLANAPDRTDLDLSGLKCPLPALRTRKALKAMVKGEVVRVTCTDPMAGLDIPHLVQETGDILLRHESVGDQLIFIIQRG